MTINYQFGDADAHGATIRAQAASSEVKQAITRNVMVDGDFWGRAGSAACQEFIIQLARDFQVIYEQANAHGQRSKPPAAAWPAPIAPSAPAGPNAECVTQQ